MESRTKFLGHAIHPMLIVYPLGLLGTFLAFDALHLVTHREMWALIADWLIAAGVVGGVVAAPFGLVDRLAIPTGTRAKAVGAWHGAGNALALLIFAIDWWLLRHGDLTAPAAPPIVLSFLGVGLSAVTGWLGGELVDRLGVVVDNGAHLNTPSSLAAGSAPSRPPVRRGRA